ncbi:hypothetical protein N7452_001143 [Penicillium brevicompactum]|uniref:Uncharacterized protein n=1 Tax=Penicillium brevicompactum TaxID=5074 RepID=A0A9W9R412_PENBR|nr:hypothetical protein N7452_001143 [Penicillium brevicompactum]
MTLSSQRPILTENTKTRGQLEEVMMTEGLNMLRLLALGKPGKEPSPEENQWKQGDCPNLQMHVSYVISSKVHGNFSFRMFWGIQRPESGDAI